MQVCTYLPRELPPLARLRAARAILRGVVGVDVELIRAGLVPPLYSADVRWQREPRNGHEEFADALTVVRRGWGDCDDLAPWLVADHIVAMQRAIAAGTLRPGRYKIPSLRLFRRGRTNLVHVLVRLPDGQLEDPSRLLGMLQRDGERVRAA